jgi:predicted phage terminase large subunit-like protein
VPGKIHRAICEAFDAVARGEVDRLLLLCPPQHGKSTVASRRVPAYLLGLHPHWEVICASATSPLAEEFGGAVRDCIASAEYRNLFPGVRLSQDTTAKGRWTTTEHGGYHAVGVGSALMGRGAEIGIIDDPFATWEDAQSPGAQQRVWQWYQGTFYNRIRPGGAIVVIQHRMHVNDLVGRLLDEQAKGGDKWHVVKLAADVDDPPWPERYDRAALERIKLNTDSRMWSSLYMQQPVAPGGGEFKRDWIERYDGPGDKLGGQMNRYLLVDPASGRRKDKDNDFTSIWVIGCAEDRNYYALDFVRDKLTLTERAAEVMRLHRKWKPYQVRYEHVGMQGDIEHLREVQRQQNYRYSITECGTGGVEKDTRIRRLLPLFEHRRMYFPTSIHRTLHDGQTRDILEDFIEQELLAFPGPRHDDGLDSLARIAEPDMPIIWPKGAEETEKKDRYARQNRKTSAWAAV